MKLKKLFHQCHIWHETWQSLHKAEPVDHIPDKRMSMHFPHKKNNIFPNLISSLGSKLVENIKSYFICSLRSTLIVYLLASEFRSSCKVFVKKNLQMPINCSCRTKPEIKVKCSLLDCT